MRHIGIAIGTGVAACVLTAQADVVTVQYTARTDNVPVSVLPSEVHVITFQPSHSYEIIGDIEVRGITSPVGDFMDQMNIVETVNVNGLALYERAEDTEGSKMVEQALREEAARNGARFVIVIQHAVARTSSSVVVHYVRARAVRSATRFAAQ